MEKVIFDEKNGLWYELQGDYYIPCLKLPEEQQKHIGVWGRRHLRYIKQNRKVLYLNLLTSGKLNGYCQRREKNNVKRREEIDANAGIKNAGIPTAGCKPPVNCLPESRPGAR